MFPLQQTLARVISVDFDQKSAIFTENHGVLCAHRTPTVPHTHTRQIAIHQSGERNFFRNFATQPMYPIKNGSVGRFAVIFPVRVCGCFFFALFASLFRSVVYARFRWIFTLHNACVSCVRAQATVSVGLRRVYTIQFSVDRNTETIGQAERKMRFPIRIAATGEKNDKKASFA